MAAAGFPWRQGEPTLEAAGKAQGVRVADPVGYPGYGQGGCIEQCVCCCHAMGQEEFLGGFAGFFLYECREICSAEAHTLCHRLDTGVGILVILLYPVVYRGYVIVRDAFFGRVGPVGLAIGIENGKGPVEQGRLFEKGRVKREVFDYGGECSCCLCGVL